MKDSDFCKWHCSLLVDPHSLELESFKMWYDLSELGSSVDGQVGAELFKRVVGQHDSFSRNNEAKISTDLGSSFVDRSIVDLIEEK